MTSTSLITVSVATFVFALVTALSAIDVGGKDALAATAAYTAVLVVIIGNEHVFQCWPSNESRYRLWNGIKMTEKKM